MNKQYKVFISSTSDLKKERQEAIDAVNKMNCTPVCMEHWAAASNPAPSTIEDKLSPCDFFVLLAGHKHGTSLEAKGESIGESYVQLEYRLAKELGKERFVFITGNKDTEVDNAQKEFRKVVIGETTFKNCDKPSEIGKFVMASLFEEILRRESAAWFLDNEGLHDVLTEYLSEPTEKNEQRIAHVVQYTAVNATTQLVRPLLRSGIPTDLYVISPTSKHLSFSEHPHQRERLDQSLAGMRNRLGHRDADIKKLLRVYGYDAPGSLRAVMVDRRSPEGTLEHEFVAISSYVYQMQEPLGKGKLILDIRGGELPGLILRPKHDGFEVIAKMVADTLSNWHEHSLATEIRLP